MLLLETLMKPLISNEENFDEFGLADSALDNSTTGLLLSLPYRNLKTRMNLEQEIRLALTLLVFVASLISNASVGILLYRFKKLRTTPNLLLLSSCIADVLNQVFNIPSFAAGYIFRDSIVFVGRPLALVLSTFHVFFTLVNLMSTTLMMLDRLCALKFNIAYRAWRTNSKALKAVATKWISCLVISMVFVIPIWDVDIGNVPTYVYRQAHFSKRGLFISLFMFPFFLVNNAVVAIVTCSIIKRENKVNAREMGLNVSRLDDTRKLNEIKAIKTIGITLILFFACYLPATACSILINNGLLSLAEASCFGFFAYLCLFVPGLLNPFIYAIRTRRFRRALVYFVKDPCGTTEIR